MLISKGVGSANERSTIPERQSKKGKLLKRSKWLKPLPNLPRFAKTVKSITMGNVSRALGCATIARKKGHMAHQCPLRKNRSSTGSQPPTQGRVYTLSGKKASESDNFIQCECLINNDSVILLFDSGTTYSFISYDCIDRFNLPILKHPFKLTVSTLAEGHVSTSSLCTPCFLVYQGRTFCVDLFCLPLSNIDIILGMDWTSFHNVVLNCANKTVFILPTDDHITCSHSFIFDDV
jgi:hypothetical protein